MCENMCSIVICRGCGLRKSLDEFGFRSKDTGARTTLCRPCTAVYQHDWYIANRDRLIPLARSRRDAVAAANRQRLWEYLAGHPCVDCGETDPVVLEFDHLFDKRQDVSQMVSNGLSWETIELEIDKCHVRCVNCHLRKTAREIGIYQQKHAFRRVRETATPYLAA
jgi:5-methylcytosine-specific restriction endonuclease McrA